MSDDNGAAPAAPESAPAPVNAVDQVPAPPPKAVEDGPSTPEAPKPEPKPVSSREALQKAAEKVNKDEADKAKADKPAPVKSEPEKPAAARDETGKFASKGPKPEGTEKPAQPQEQVQPLQAPPKPAAPVSDAPSRFSNDAKAEWAKAPEPVRAEVARMERELSAGLEKYRASHEAFEPVREFHDMAQKGGTDLRTALTKYVGLENLLRSDPIGGLEQVCANIGVSLNDVAAHVMGQTPEQSQSRSDATIRELRQELASLKEQVGGVTNTIQEQKTAAVQKDVLAFWNENPRAEELAEDIAFFLQSGRAKDLPEAYALAERLNPAPAQPTPAPPPAPVTPPQVHPDRGSKSIAGAPTPGSDPASKPPSKSSREAVRRAFEQAGAS